VGTKFEQAQAYTADPLTVMEMLRDPAFVELKCQRTGSRETTVEITDGSDGTVTISTVRVLPANLPAVAKPFVGETLTVTEVQVWSAPGQDGTRTAEVTVGFSAPITFKADMTLASDGEASVVTTRGEFTANVPFVGGKIENVAVGETARYLNVEEKVGHEWLTQRG